ncbi:MAG TPA: hypothetical protein VFB33_15635 [Candidatus Binataceae bacterium]|jgi:hypothetical protein|nr:hypothetical protein [Candidatus Binataceae bacterium]
MTLRDAAIAAATALMLALAALPARAHQMPAGSDGEADAAEDAGPAAMMGMRGAGTNPDAADSAMASEHMVAHAAMAAHMAWSHTRPETAADRERAEQLVATLRATLAKYKDYHVAEADGFKPFHPELPQRFYHFTRWQNGLKAAFTFDPAAPTSLLYRRTADGGYQLVGAMYTAPRGASEAQLDARVPLSVATWHRHVNLCFPPKGRMRNADWTRFGVAGSISTRAACEAAGGRFYPQIFGWMVHVYPWAKTEQEIFAH